MKKLGILLDSFGGVSEKVINEAGFEMIPLQFTIDDVNYIDDGNTLTNREVSEKVKNCTSAATSLPALARIEDTLAKMNEEYENVIAFVTSSAISSTYQTTVVSSRQYGDKFKIIDNHFFGNQAFELAKMLVELSDKGIEIDRLVEIATDVANRSQNFLIVKDLSSLIRGGRLKGIKKVILNSLKLIPLLKVDETGINFSGLKRTLKGSYSKVIEKLIEFIGGETKLEDYEFRFMYAGDEEMFEKAKETLEGYDAKIDKEDIASATVLVHTGFGCSSIGVWPKLSKLKI
ncbi:DegV family protein [Mycoplasma procyoni]|uniref:DegV family protein n=1 Tax=Mycoplasma procyoni TaxID=568784 RepID=UPI00197C014A|nr:DegV family protein [Mycoplasma procyoni]MBN3535021.1 DegV family protein [Mycoplasma procyoni]